MTKLQHRKATIHDVPTLVQLLCDDELGKTREQLGGTIDKRYIEAFRKIDSDPNQYLMIVMLNSEVIGTCHLTLMPSLTFTGSMRMQIEAVRVCAQHRGHKVGEWMMQQALEYAKNNHVSIIQLSTNKKRPRAKQFYERLGFKATHEGMKLYV